ncbi:DUF5685 family protein [Aureispira sp. CCB-QB1]|uniref:DUF5685 family protein n=1 Tax=Aureispira sp. CCB-QB1 TaxID=1313421 RepID=UPI000A8D647C|nr:DUF5685 family protein [Aureispira sp. CCB-QB1]
MFGLMHPQNTCSTKKNNSNYLYHRRHYCGTCKAIGKNYNQQSRLMLNWDTVFLSELLSQLEHENFKSWSDRLKTVNTCFSIPKEKLPFSLEYAATVSVLLGTLKINDNNQDEPALKWKFAQCLYTSSQKKVLLQFEHWGIDTIYIQSIIQQQYQRERKKIQFKHLHSCLNYYAEATAKITAYLFQQGGLRLQQKTDLYQLGYSFGQLIYILDAFEDYEKDVFKDQFNPLIKYFGSFNQLDESNLESVRSILLDIQAEIDTHLQQLSITAEAISIYKDRLASNLALRLYQERRIPKTINDQIALRWNEAKIFANQITCQPKTWLRQLNYYVIVLAVFANPQTKTYLPQEGKLQIVGWTLLMTTILASIGIAGVVRRDRKKQKDQKRKEKRIKRLKRKIKNLFRKKDCWSDCCSNCCNQCCSDSCSNCCGDCCEWMCQEDNLMITVILLISIVAITTIIILILFFLGLL